MARKGFLAKCSKKYIEEDTYMILDYNSKHRATVSEGEKIIRLNWDIGYEYHTQLIRDLYSDYEEKKLYIRYF